MRRSAFTGGQVHVDALGVGVHRVVPGLGVAPRQRGADASMVLDGEIAHRRRREVIFQPLVERAALHVPQPDDGPRHRRVAAGLGDGDVKAAILRVAQVVAPIPIGEARHRRRDGVEGCVGGAGRGQLRDLRLELDEARLDAIVELARREGVQGPAARLGRPGAPAVDVER